MKGTMMQFPLTLDHLLERAGTLFPTVEIVSSRPDNSIHRYTYGEMHRRARALAAALQELGLQCGDRVATLMWNHRVHLEAYLGIPSVGGVLHTLNLRLHPDELAHIINDAQDRWLIVDDVLLPVYEKIRNKVCVQRVFVVPFSGKGPASAGDDYESLLASSGGCPTYPHLDEHDAAAMCYTSGTTGQPKGVAYSHRALALHSYSISLPDNFAISRCDCVLPSMSMFHANAWGFPYAAVMNGSKLVLPGPNLQSERLLDLLEAEQVTLAGGVPTIWLGGPRCARTRATTVAPCVQLAGHRGRLGGAGKSFPPFRDIRSMRDSTLGNDGNHTHRDRLHPEAPHADLAGGAQI